ncbi:MAG: RNA polymerase II mediator complex subunit [Sclerophora amabilis]|nr:MAG: RNA polymerase II mediator complex subunit [Sclerophora amabilis]
MTDRLTQLQDALDQANRPQPLPHAPHWLATQFYASIRYVTTHHPHSALPLPPQPSQQQHPTQSSNITITTNSNNNNNNNTQPLTTSAPQTPAAPQNDLDPSLPRPDSPSTFAAAQRELARDLILKEQQIEYLISVLPGIGTSEKEQEERIRVLEGELKEAEEQRRKVGEERERLVERVEGVITRVWGRRE